MLYGSYWNRNYVKVTYLPLGIEAVCMAHRSQHQNRFAAMKRMESLIYAKEQGIEPSTEVVRTYRFPDGVYWVDDLMEYGRDLNAKENI